MDERPKGDFIGFRAMLRDQEMERRLHKLELEHLTRNSRPMSDHVKSESYKFEDPAPMVGLPLFCTFIATLVSAFCFYSSQSLYICVAALCVMVWAALWTTHQSAKTLEFHHESRKQSSFISEISIMTATLGGLAIWGLVCREWGLPLSLADGIVSFAGLSALVSALLGSRLALIMSALAGLVWLGFYTIVPTINIISIWTFPLLALVQFFIAGQGDSKFSTAIALIGAHVWLFWLLNDRLVAGDISLIHIAAFSMMIGLAHYRLGKAAGDALWETATLHVIFGWGLTMAGAIGLQHYWLGTNPVLWETVSSHPLSELSWQFIGAATIALVGIAGLIRMAHNQMSSMAVIFTLCVAVAAAAIYDQRIMIEHYVQSELNMSARPLVGLLIGGAITASAIAMCVNGARRKSMVMMLVGLAVIAAELTLMLDPNIWTAESGLAFTICLAGSLCLAALFAADTSNEYA